MRAFKWIWDFFYPPRCILCGESRALNADMLCPACAALEVTRLFRFFSVSVRGHDYTLECRAPMRYEDPFRTTLHRLKFRGETALAAPIAKRMAMLLEQDTAFDCIVPAPLGAMRLKERGYNQAALLAEALSADCGVPVRHSLQKTRENCAQHRLTAKERERNVRGAYSAQDVNGLRVLFVDDIVTTGATARECAKTLYRAGASFVACISAAIVP